MRRADAPRSAVSAARGRAVASAARRGPLPRRALSTYNDQAEEALARFMAQKEAREAAEARAAEAARAAAEAAAAAQAEAAEAEAAAAAAQAKAAEEAAAAKAKVEKAQAQAAAARPLWKSAVRPVRPV